MFLIQSAFTAYRLFIQLVFYQNERTQLQFLQKGFECRKKDNKPFVFIQAYKLQNVEVE